MKKYAQGTREAQDWNVQHSLLFREDLEKMLLEQTWKDECEIDR